MTRFGRRRVLTDECVESYVRWREACADVRVAYQRWTDCDPGYNDLRFALYCAALDWEEHAAGVYSLWMSRLGAAVR
jgi:hypothetical protein